MPTDALPITPWGWYSRHEAKRAMRLPMATVEALCASGDLDERMHPGAKRPYIGGRSILEYQQRQADQRQPTGPTWQDEARRRKQLRESKGGV